MAAIELNLLDANIGYFGFSITGQQSTVAGAFCKLIGEGLIKQRISIVVDESRSEVAVLMEGVSINFEQSPHDIKKISKLLGGPLRAEEYFDGESMGVMLIAQ